MIDLRFANVLSVCEHTAFKQNGIDFGATHATKLHRAVVKCPRECASPAGQFAQTAWSAESMVRVEHSDALDRAHPGNTPVFANDLSRPAPVVQHQALFRAFAHFRFVGRHLIAALKAHNMHLALATEAHVRASDVICDGLAEGHIGGVFLLLHRMERTHSGASDIISHVAAADDDNFVANRERRAVVEGA
jgi:hypothetical protein